jgi:hypothetical protein
MKTREEFEKERKENKERKQQAFLAKIRGQRSPNQQRLFERMGITVKVSKPPET